MTEQANKYPGYTLVRREASPLFHGTATTLTHDVSGATVLLIENEDENKAFGIGFGTFPCDDTGVFHILEHSVLAGSEKYPVTSPFMQLVKSSMASFLNAMTFPDKTVYPFATPNEADFRNLMDVYLNAVFCPLAVTERSVFEQEGWHREADGHFSGVVYNEMQGALAAPEARLDAAMDAALFPDNGYGFVSGGDPASIPGLSYEQYVKIYRRHYRPDNCCITLYGKMEMAEKLAFLDEHYLSRMPKGAPRPRTPLQYPQAGVKKTVVYETETPESIPVQCALGWYTGRFEEMEKQTAVNVLLDALLATNQSPLKKYLLEQNLGADIDVGFDGSVQQPVIELVLKGADSARAARFAQAVREGVEAICAAGIPDELLTASINSYEFQVTERPGSLPDGVLAAIEAATGWLHTGDPMADLRPEPVFDFLRGKLGTNWYNELLRELFAPAPVEVTLLPQKPRPADTPSARQEGKLQLDHPLTVADLGQPPRFPAAEEESLAGLTLVGRPSAGSLYLNFYYDLGALTAEEMDYAAILPAVLDELDSARHTAIELSTLRNTWLGESTVTTSIWTGRQPGAPCIAKLTARASLLERNLDKAVELMGELLYETKLTGPQAQAALEQTLGQLKLNYEQDFIRSGHNHAILRAGRCLSVQMALTERTGGVSMYRLLCRLLAEQDWAGLAARLEAVREKILRRCALTVCCHGSEAARARLRALLPGSLFAAADRAPAQSYSEPLPAPRHEAFVIQGGVNYDVLAWPSGDPSAARKVLAQVMSYEYLWQALREKGGAYGAGMLNRLDYELFYTYRDPHAAGTYRRYAEAPAAVAGVRFTPEALSECIVGTVGQADPPRKPRQQALEADRRYFCGLTPEMAAADRAALCGVTGPWLNAEAAALADKIAHGVRCTFGSREAIERAEGLFDTVEVLG